MDWSDQVGLKLTTFWLMAPLFILAPPSTSSANPLPTRYLYGQQFRNTTHVQITYGVYKSPTASAPVSAPTTLLRDGQEMSPTWRGPFLPDGKSTHKYQLFYACDCSLKCGNRVYKTRPSDAGHTLMMQVYVDPAQTKRREQGVLDCIAECGGPGRLCSPPDPGSFPWGSPPDLGADAPRAAPDAPPSHARDMTVRAPASGDGAGCAVGSTEGQGAGWSCPGAVLLALFGLRRKQKRR